MFFADRYLLNKRTCGEAKDAVYVGRPSKWGNPFRVEVYGRSEAIVRYENFLLNSELLNDLDELYNKQIVCHCYPLACHGDILLKYLYIKHF